MNECIVLRGQSDDTAVRTSDTSCLGEGGDARSRLTPFPRPPGVVLVECLGRVKEPERRLALPLEAFRLKAPVAPIATPPGLLGPPDRMELKLPWRASPPLPPRPALP